MSHYSLRLSLRTMCSVSSCPRITLNVTERSFLIIAIASNLGLLAIMKYADFFIATANNVLLPLNVGPVTILDIVLPLGISFFTFTQIAFLVDTYRGHINEKNFIHYFLFVSYFPHLIAGPVIHHKQMMPQFSQDSTYSVSYNNIAMGVTFFSIGLFKKVFLADGIAIYANGLFNAVAGGGNPTFFEAWAGALAYALQLYFDFSGYCDMAIGISLFLNIKLPINFDSPYKSSDIIEFWRRWHMTLSAFLRDYLYIPLGGNRDGKLMRYRNIMITMLLGGLWHGAGWTFVLWGGLHGAYLVINNEWKKITGGGLNTFLPNHVAKFVGCLHNVYGCCCRVGTFPLGKFFNINEILFRDALSKRNKLSSFVGASVKRIGAIEVDYFLWSFAFAPLEFL